MRVEAPEAAGLVQVATTIGDGCLIGMGAKLLNNSMVGDGAFVAAGALVLEGMEIPAGHVAMGMPAKDRGPMESAMAERVRTNAFHYQELAAKYRDSGL